MPHAPRQPAPPTQPAGGADGRPSRRPRRARGFTLIEAALTTVIVGTGVLALVGAQQAFLRKNDWAQRTGTAILLANEIRELTLALPLYDPIYGQAEIGPGADETSVQLYDNLYDFAGPVQGGQGAGLTFNPPINAQRQTIAGMERWTQKVKVENVLPDHISASYGQPLGTTDLARVTVTIEYQSHGQAGPMTVTELVWVVGLP